MSTYQPQSRASGSGPGGQVPPTQLLEQLRRGTVARVQPMLAETQLAVDAELRKLLQADPPPPGLDDDLTNLSILRREVTAYERRWQERIGAGFEGWPQAPAKAASHDAYVLVSDDELNSQLVGQPVIETLERRFVDILDVIGSRLWSFAASLGGQARPTNPVEPRRFIESFLETYPASECNASLRQIMLRQYVRIAGEQLGAVYAWFNAQLSDAGHAMSTANDYAMLMASPLGRVAAPAESAKTQVWSDDNALPPTESTWRGDKARSARKPRDPLDAFRGNGLREQARRRRQAQTLPDSTGNLSGPGAQTRRELGIEEFLAVLSLLQGDASNSGDDGGDIGGYLRWAFAKGAAGLGMSVETTAPSSAQEDAIDVVGALFDGLIAQHALSDQARASLILLAPPYLRLSLDDPYLFDDVAHPALETLSLLVQCWDANHRDNPADDELHVLADDAARDIVDSYHGNGAVFERVLAQLQQGLGTARKRAEIAERRAWQSVQGRERLQAARQQADRRLRDILQAQPLLATVAEFLSDQWRQSLIHAWLRDGPDSDQFAAMVAVGEAIARVDADAAQAHGHAVADGLLALQQPLRDCHVACGLDENGANMLLARLVAELAHPDAVRAMHPFTALVDESLPVLDGDHGNSDVAVGQTLVLAGPDLQPQALRLAWRSPLSGACLLVNRQGARELLLASDEFEAMLADGRLLARSEHGPVEAQLRSMVQSQTGAQD